MLTWVIVVIEGDWRLLGILNRKSAEELNDNYTVSIWHLEGEGGRRGERPSDGHIQRWLGTLLLTHRLKVKDDIGSSFLHPLHFSIGSLH